ncbi:MAG TPA: heavy metal-binding domain-containing protein [Streptosporangiaceae bacterium]
MAVAGLQAQHAPTLRCEYHPSRVWCWPSRLDRLIEAGQARGADAILAMRFDVNELQGIGQEICAYGTAVKVRRKDY